MEWSKQAEEMLNTWTETQKKLWDSYFESIPDFGKSPSEQVWDQTVATGKQAFKNTMAAQVDWVNAWVENLGKMEGIPEEAKESAVQFKEMSKRWGETQETMWENWFEMLKKFDISRMTPNWTGATQDPFKAWQESTQKVMEAQSNWMNSWGKAMGGSQDGE